MNLPGALPGCTNGAADAEVSLTEPATVKVKILDRIAGPADGSTDAELDAKYAKMRSLLRLQSPEAVERSIERRKRKDNYGAPRFGFASAWVFQPGDEPEIDARLAAALEGAGVCRIL